MPVEELLAAFENYVSNNVPIHILDVRSIQVTSDINDVTLLTREDIRRISRPKIEALQEADILADKALLGCEEWEDWHKGDLTPLIQRHIKYAIFSHRWSSTGEPSFNDVSQRNDSSGDGWTKLLNFCKKAKEYGCDYAWSDTCCINKTSSAELEEAIRSMYRWYSSAEICIAYLERSSNVKDFGTEPWFTRGWTLQELLAPRKTKFYGKEWNPILPHVPLESNDKEQHDISSAIEQTTRIPQHQLISFRPGCYRVWEKLLWASRRTTTRAEDMAYCLIGMLDISMSIAYGEGDWAFHRLMETILQRCDEPEIFAW
ncbi:heterokaryon incompatibility protein-domain-containing protein, partial [Scleroderma citrinum]